MPFMDSIKIAHPSWQPLLVNALKAMDQAYLASLNRQTDWLPGQDKIFAAFQLPREKVRFILLGESPYPRVQSANGYAFWDAAVDSLWSETGLSKSVNRATSLRNIIKMLLHARGDLQQDFSQPAISALDKSQYVQTIEQLFQSFMNQGFLLLNATLVYQKGEVNAHARHWQAFMKVLLSELLDVKLVLLGRIANQLPAIDHLTSFQAEHPYNVSFVTNQAVRAFFKPFDLLHHDINH